MVSNYVLIILKGGTTMTISLPTTKIPAGRYISVEVYGVPGDDGKVLTYRAHADVRVGELVVVPAPEWVENMTKYQELPGRVLGTATGDSLPGNDVVVRSTMPLYGPESDSHGLLEAEAQETIARWRK